MSKINKRPRSPEVSSPDSPLTDDSLEELPELDDLLNEPPKKKRKINPKPKTNNNNNTNNGGKKQVKDYFGVDSSRIHQRLESVEYEQYEQIDDNEKRRARDSSDDEMDFEVQQMPEIPSPSKDEPVTLSSEMLESRLELVKFIINGDGTDVGLYNVFVSPKEVEEVIKTAFLDDAEFQLLPSGSIDFTSIKAKQTNAPATSGAVSVGEGSLNGNEPNFNVADPMQYLCAKQAGNMRIFLRAQKLIFMLNYYKYEETEVKHLFERWQRARYACQQAFEFARSQIMWNRCKFETFNPNRYMNAVDFYLERMSFHIGETRDTIGRMKKRGAAQIAEYISIHLQMDDLRRNPSGTMLYQQLMQQSGKPTFTWHPYKTLAQYIIDKCYPDSQLYSALTDNAATLQAILGILAPDGTKGANSPEHPCLPIVRMNRYLFAYRNGVYDTKVNKFYDNPALCPHENLTACRFFDADFDIKWLDPKFNWRDIKTPNIESIMKHQEFDVQGKRAEEEALSRAGKTPPKDDTKTKGKGKKPTKEDHSKSSQKARSEMSPDQQQMYKQLDEWEADPHSLIDWIYAFGGRLGFDQAEMDRWESA